MPRLLVVHHTPSPALQEMFEAAVSGARTDQIEGIEVVIRPALTAGAADMLEADGYLLGTLAALNVSYLSARLRYPALELGLHGVVLGECDLAPYLPADRPGQRGRPRGFDAPGLRGYRDRRRILRLDQAATSAANRPQALPELVL